MAAYIGKKLDACCVVNEDTAAVVVSECAPVAHLGDHVAVPNIS
jgi:hypothetical protein